MHMYNFDIASVLVESMSNFNSIAFKNGLPSLKNLLLYTAASTYLDIYDPKIGVELEKISAVWSGAYSQPFYFVNYADFADGVLAMEGVIEILVLFEFWRRERKTLFEALFLDSVLST